MIPFFHRAVNLTARVLIGGVLPLVIELFALAQRDLDLDAGVFQINGERNDGVAVELDLGGQPLDLTLVHEQAGRKPKNTWLAGKIKCGHCGYYTALFEHMLDHDLIDVFCDVDARDLFEIDETTVKIDGKVYGGEIVYTGPLDELFNLDLGALPYRTLDMKFETLDMDQFQPVGTVNYTTSED